MLYQLDQYEIRILIRSPRAQDLHGAINEKDVNSAWKNFFENLLKVLDVVAEKVQNHGFLVIC